MTKEDINKFLEKFKQKDHSLEFPIEIPENVELSEYESMPVLLNPIAKKAGPAAPFGKVNPRNLPDGYFCLGFWGHGINSYRIYFAKSNEWENIYLEMFYGGGYMDNKSAAEDIKEMMNQLIELEKCIREKTKKLHLLYRLGGTEWKIELKDGKTKETKFNFLNLETHFDEIKKFALTNN